MPEAVSLIASRTNRMSSVDACLYYGALEDFRSLLNGPTPTLKVVRIRGEGYLSHVQSLPSYSPSFQGRFPALRTLWLEGYPFDLARSVPAMANGLTELVLYSRQFHHLRNLLDYMEHCANLEHLKIELPGLHGTGPASRVNAHCPLSSFFPTFFGPHHPIGCSELRPGRMISACGFIGRTRTSPHI